MLIRQGRKSSASVLGLFPRRSSLGIVVPSLLSVARLRESRTQRRPGYGFVVAYLSCLFTLTRLVKVSAVGISFQSI